MYIKTSGLSIKDSKAQLKQGFNQKQQKKIKQSILFSRNSIMLRIEKEKIGITG